MDRFVIRPGNKGPQNPDTDKKRKSKSRRDHEYDKKRKCTFQDQWLNEFPWTNAGDVDSAFCTVCRSYPQLADKTSSLFIGKKVERKDTLTTHQLSAKHIACMSKY